MDQNETKWKQKYLSTLDKHEKKERSWNDLEEMLRLGMTRVALAAQGVDKKLDKQLNKLRKSIRSGSYDGLEYIVEDISQSVKRLDNVRDENESGDKATSDNKLPEALLQLINTLTFPAEVKKQVSTLQKQLGNTTANQPVDDVLRKLAALINNTLATENNSGKKTTNPVSETKQNTPQSNGLLGRLFGGEPDSSAAVQSDQSAQANTASTLSIAAGILQQLLQSLKKSTGGSESVSRLSDQLASANSERGLHDITHNLGQLIDVTLKQNSEQLVATQSNATQAATATEATIPDNAVQTDPVASKPEHADNSANASAELTRPPETSPSTLQATETPQLQTAQSAPASTLDQHQPAIAEFCLSLLEHLQLPQDFDEDVQNLRDKIVNSTQASESASLLNEIADLITATRTRVEKEKQDLQDFLRQLTDKLKDIDEHLAGAETSSKASFNSRKILGDAVEMQVKNIETSVQDAPESGQLKKTVQQHLDTIRDHVISYQQGEEKSQRNLLDELSKSNMRLSELEQETEQLRARLSEEHAQATHDKLTGIYNRLAYEEHIEQEYQRWKRYKKPLVLLVFDIDHFKNINDTYGHRAGDKALRLIAQTLQNNLRTTDFLARYGGEEFVVLMPETDIENAMNVANKLREAVLDVKFNYQKTEVSISVSCGASQFSKGDSAGDVFQRADKSLYQAKQNGRNQCCTNDA